MVSTTYGRSTGLCIDPIEKKPLFHFYPGTAVLSFGTAGCNLGCQFCQNWSTSKSRDADLALEAAEPEAIARTALEAGCRSVAFTYNDPIIWAEYAIDTARACRQLGIKTVAVTSGYILPPARETFFAAMDAANVDLKGFSEDFYERLTGGHLAPVLDTLRWLVQESKVWVEITNLVIPQENDSPEGLHAMCDWIAATLGPNVPLHLTAFHPAFQMMDRGPTPVATLLSAHQIARNAGLHYVYTGNLPDPRHQTTYCPGCHRAVIVRDGYALANFELGNSRCHFCNTSIAGHFDPRPGEWGNQRRPMRISLSTLDSLQSPGPRVEPTMENHETAPSVPTASRPELNPNQEQQVLRAAGACVAATVQSKPCRPMAELLASAAEIPVFGAFVTLKRSGQLRSCCGFLGQTVPLHEALYHAAIRAAKDDPRFPPISPGELDYLDIDVWLLWGSQPVTAKGEARAETIVIGKHGLQISLGNARGLLLPGVAVEHHLDVLGFLRQVCLKAGLPAEAWKDDRSHLATFEGFALQSPLAEVLAPLVPERSKAEATVSGSSDSEPIPQGVAPHGAPGPTTSELVRLAEACCDNLSAIFRGATPSYYMPDTYDGDVNAVLLSVRLPNWENTIDCIRFSLRPEMPLQATLFELVQTAARTIQSLPVPNEAIQRVQCALCVLWDPAMHGTVNQPTLEGIDPRRRAVVVARESKWAMVFNPEQTPEQLVWQAVERLHVAGRQGQSIYSLAAASTAMGFQASNVAIPEPGEPVRPPAQAGRFYPADPVELDRTLDQMLPAVRTPEFWAGVLVPHAGWIYSGRLAATTLSRVQIPSRVIIVCPKHHVDGSDWAVAPHQTWSLPGREVASDPGLARRIAECVPGMILDAQPHRVEHAIEVQLPILARLAPEARVVGIAIHGGDPGRLKHAAEALAELLAGLPERPLLVISSDMNHYADEAHTREVDRLAIEAMESLDPEKLYRTVVNHRISMCGALPAVLVMATLRRLGLLTRCQSVGYTTSGEVSGDMEHVVGYAGMLFG